MSSGQKVALSFLAALVCFAGFCFFAQSELLSAIETKFYAQAKIAQRQEQLDKLSKSCNNYISNILNKIQNDSASYLKDPSVKSYFNQNPSEKDEVTRRNLTNELFDTLEGLDGLRLIESNGRNVHFSTYDNDVLKTNGLVKQYKNYPDIKEEFDELDVDTILTSVSSPKHKITLDGKDNRIIISFPFYITDKTSVATLVCYFNIYDFTQTLVNQDLLPLGESFDLVIDDDGNAFGFACGLPSDGKKDFTKAILNSWKVAPSKTNKGPENLISQSNGTNWVLLNSGENESFRLGWVYKASVFELPKELVYIIYVSVGMTLVLIFLLLFSLKKDYLIKIKQRIKKVQLGIINEYLENKQEIQWDQIARQLEYRKEELSLEIKKSIGAKNRKKEKAIDVYLEQSWSEILSIINSQNKNAKTGLSGASIEEIRRVMEEVLQSANLKVSLSQNAQSVQELKPETIENIEELSGAQDIDTLEEISDIEPLEVIEAGGSGKEEDADEVLEELEMVDISNFLDDSELEELASDEPPLEMTSPSSENEQFHYVESNRTFESAASDDFATCDTIFAEDLCIGPHYTPLPSVISEDFEFVVYVPDFTPNQNDGDFDDLEELTLQENSFFSMTSFAQNELPISELEDAFENDNINVIKDDTAAIVEKKGVYSISDNLQYSQRDINPEFKQLVDSVLFR